VSRRDFGQNLLAMMEANGLNKADVARRIGVSPSTMTRWTSEGREVSGQHLLALAAVLGVEPRVLLGSSFVEPTAPVASPKRGRPISAKTVDEALDGPKPEPAGSVPEPPPARRCRA
jgi:transcriptional regulator with XRE-family HTH domain